MIGCGIASAADGREVAGRWRYVYRAIDQYGQIIDVYVSARRDTQAARRFFTMALRDHGEPAEVVTNRAWTLRAVIDELMPAAFHNTEQYANNRIEADHGRLKARLRPMRGLKRDQSARVIVRGHAVDAEHPARPLRTRRRGVRPSARRVCLHRAHPNNLSGPGLQLDPARHGPTQRNSAGGGHRAELTLPPGQATVVPQGRLASVARERAPPLTVLQPWSNRGATTHLSRSRR